MNAFKKKIRVAPVVQKRKRGGGGGSYFSGLDICGKIGDREKPKKIIKRDLDFISLNIGMIYDRDKTMLSYGCFSLHWHA